jgi:putative ABC transport system substrate-binding protein
MKRRTFIAGLGSTAAWPVLVGGQQQSMPVIGFLGGGTPSSYANRIAAFHRGLGEAGFVEGRNVFIEYRWAEGQYDRLQAHAIELVGRRPTVTVGSQSSAAFAAKAATTTIPIVYAGGGEPGIYKDFGGASSSYFGLSAALNEDEGVANLFWKIIHEEISYY